MKFKEIDSNIDFNDPETNFSFEFQNNDLILRFNDYKNRLIEFKFEMVYHFRYFISDILYLGCPCAKLVEVEDSEIIDELFLDLTVSDSDELHHIIFSTNEAEYCEVVSESYSIKIIN